MSHTHIDQNKAEGNLPQVKVEGYQFSGDFFPFGFALPNENEEAHRRTLTDAIRDHDATAEDSHSRGRASERRSIRQSRRSTSGQRRSARMTGPAHRWPQRCVLSASFDSKELLGASLTPGANLLRSSRPVLVLLFNSQFKGTHTRTELKA